MNQLEYISRQLMVIGGIVMITFGLTGNILNLFIFKIWSFSRGKGRGRFKTSNFSNSPLYLLITSISNTVVICYGLLTRILFDGYQYPVTDSNVVFLCKIRYYALHTFDTISWTCLAMAIFDRYLVSSREVRLRQLSKTRQGTKLIIFIIIVINGIHGVPLAIYYTVSKSAQCTINSTIYLHYYRYVFQIFLHGIIPIIVFSILGILTYKQLKMLRERQNFNNRNVDKQLSRMFVLISTTIVVSGVPYSIENTYYLIFADSTQQQIPLVFFFHIISSLMFYINPVFNFYIYLVSTPNFRYQARKVIVCQYDQRNNQIHATTITQPLNS